MVSFLSFGCAKNISQFYQSFFLIISKFTFHIMKFSNFDPNTLVVKMFSTNFSWVTLLTRNFKSLINSSDSKSAFCPDLFIHFHGRHSHLVVHSQKTVCYNPSCQLRNHPGTYNWYFFSTSKFDHLISRE